MSGRLEHCKVAILAVDGFEEAELVEPQRALSAEGAQVDVISQKRGEIQGFRHVDKGGRVKVDRTFDDAREGDYDAVVLPGGVVNGDAIRMLPAAREFVTAAVGAGKPIAAICHGGWLLVSAGLVEGRTMTSWPSLQDDIRHAGGKWVDEEVVRDGNLITSRKPADLPAFNGALVERLASRGRKPMPADAARRVTLTDTPPVFDGAALQLSFVVDVDGVPQTCAITVEALEDHFGAQSALEADLRDAFERGRARIEAACAEVLADGGGADVVLHSGYFRAPGGRVRAGLFGPGKS